MKPVFVTVGALEPGGLQAEAQRDQDAEDPPATSGGASAAEAIA